MILQELKTYLDKTLGLQVQTRAWENTKALPFYLPEKYDFYTAQMLDSNCLFMVAKVKDESTPAVIKKHFLAVKKNWNGVVVYVAKAVAPYNRTRLIEQKVPFIAPDKQLYLPDLGLDLREHVEKARNKKVTLSPATQVVILDALIQARKPARNVRSLAGEYGYTTMTITRVLDEIEELGLGSVYSIGRERQLAFEMPKMNLWESAMPHLKNPVVKTVYARNLKPGKDVVVAGLSALSKYSNIAEMNHVTCAVSRNKQRSLELNEKIQYIPSAEDGSVQLEVWRYWPERLAQDGIVDKFSLFLSLKDDRDERVQKALKMMMENVF